jgi:hypothetical protein
MLVPRWPPLVLEVLLLIVLSVINPLVKAAVLLGSGAAIFVTNVIVFGVWYWELDRGCMSASRT